MLLSTISIHLGRSEHNAFSVLRYRNDLNGFKTTFTKSHKTLGRQFYIFIRSNKIVRQAKPFYHFIKASLTKVMDLLSVCG